MTYAHQGSVPSVPLHHSVLETSWCPSEHLSPSQEAWVVAARQVYPARGMLAVVAEPCRLSAVQEVERQGPRRVA